MEKEYKNLHTLTKEQLEVIKLVAEIQDKKYASGMFRFLDMLQKIAAIITPFILFYLGSRFNAQQRIDGEEKEKINRVATLIKSLSSENLSEKQLAFSYARYLATKGLYPKEMINAISVAANQDSTGALATDARSLLTTLKTA
ncbi:MAG: hypothetical protein EBZ77_10925, partial [Chitinophagia bacterium]|nr:hypothetical protein [Chitinophagia bacterium]